MTQSLLTEYRHWYGKLRGREPALLYHDGAFLVAAFSPLIEPEDFPVTYKSAAIFGNLCCDRHDVLSRPSQHFVAGGLWPNILKEFPDEKQANDLAVATAIHALFRQPTGTVRLCTSTALLFLETATLVVDRPTPRFLTSAAWLVLLLFGLTANDPGASAVAALYKGVKE